MGMDVFKHRWNSTTGKWEKDDGAITGTTSGFTPSTYTGTITSSNAGTAFAIESATTKIQLHNYTESATTDNAAVIAFGTSAANAQDNLAVITNVSTAGILILPILADVALSEPVIVGVPANATHAALGNLLASTNQTVRVTQGV